MALSTRARVSFRPAHPESDAARLVTFRCSSGPGWESEVERHLQRDACWMAAHRGELNHRLWLGFVEEQLVAVGAHEEATTLQVRGLWPTMLVVAAVALVWAGRLA